MTIFAPLTSTVYVCPDTVAFRGPTWREAAVLGEVLDPALTGLSARTVLRSSSAVAASGALIVADHR